MDMDKGITEIQETLSERLIKLHEDQKVTKGRVTKLEKDHADHQAAILDISEDVDQKSKKLEDAISKLKEKLDSYELFQKRLNLRFHGFPEAVEGRDAISFLQEWIPKILDLPPSAHPLEIERAHRTLRRRLPGQVAPRAFVITFLRYQDTVRILSAARAKGELKYGDSKFMIFPDLSPKLHKRRMAFSPLKRLLRQAGLAYGLRYPATLWMETKNGERIIDFMKMAETYMRKELPDLFMPTTS